VEVGAWGWPSGIWETGRRVEVSWAEVEAARRVARRRRVEEVLGVCILGVVVERGRVVDVDRVIERLKEDLLCSRVRESGRCLVEVSMCFLLNSEGDAAS
jgi:hypothetical protein